MLTIAPIAFPTLTPARTSTLSAIVLEPGEGYVTTAGDTLNIIAQRNDLTPAQLRYLNPNHFVYYNADQSLPAGVYIRLKDTAPQVGVILRGYQVTDEGGRIAQTTTNPVISLPPVPYTAKAGEGLWQLAERVKSDNAPYLDGVSTDDIVQKIISDNPKLAESYTPGSPYPDLYKGMKVVVNIGTPPGWDRRVELALRTVFSDLGPEVRRQLAIAAVSIAAVLALSCVFPATIAALGPILTGVGIGISLVTLGEVTAMLFDVAQHGYSDAKITEMAEAQRANLVTGTITATTLGASKVLPKMPSGARPARTATAAAEEPPTVTMRQGTDGVWRAPPGQGVPPTGAQQTGAYAPTDLVFNPRSGVWEPPAPAPSQPGVPITPRQAQPAAGQNTPTAYANPPVLEPYGSPIASPVVINTEPEVVEVDHRGGGSGPPRRRPPNRGGRGGGGDDGPDGPNRGGDDGSLPPSDFDGNLDQVWNAYLIGANSTVKLPVKIDITPPGATEPVSVIYKITMTRNSLENAVPEGTTFRQLQHILRQAITSSRFFLNAYSEISDIENNPEQNEPDMNRRHVGDGHQIVDIYDEMTDLPYMVLLDITNSTVSPGSYFIFGTAEFGIGRPEDHAVRMNDVAPATTIDPTETNIVNLNTAPITEAIADLERDNRIGITGQEVNSLAWRCEFNTLNAHGRRTISQFDRFTLRRFIDAVGAKVQAAHGNTEPGSHATIRLTFDGRPYTVAIEYTTPWFGGAGIHFQLLDITSAVGQN